MSDQPENHPKPLILDYIPPDDRNDQVEFEVKPDNKIDGFPNIHIGYKIKF